MAASMTVHSDGEDGALQTITITQTGADTARISLISPDETDNEDVKNVQADPANLILTCQLDAFLLTADIRVAVQRVGADKRPIATVTVSNAIAFTGSHTYTLRVGEDALVLAFLKKAAFPPL